jgi:hypothetical protein
MMSSLAHVLLVTPVIFYWLRERELRREAAREGAPLNWRPSADAVAGETVAIDPSLPERPAREAADGHSVPTITERRNNG